HSTKWPTIYYRVTRFILRCPHRKPKACTTKKDTRSAFKVYCLIVISRILAETLRMRDLPEARSSSAFQVIMAMMAGIYMVGASYLVCFQAVLADDACWARGYRAGSKILRLATFMDLLSSTMQFIFYLYISKFYSAKWYTHFLEGGSERIFFSYIRCMHALACLLFACAYYLLEVYHDEGAGDLHAYINASLFGLAGAVEFSVLFVGMSGVAAVFIWVALAALTAWACFFEPEVNEASPALYETELTNDVEQQVEKFARMSPYYPTESEGGLPPSTAAVGGGPPATATSGPMLLSQQDVAAKAS
ncbi:uncharacterized protein LOC131478935, partial [Ochotona princeps]|uniref:uncharacterized protein LOC131478935 n=1 Tax=Ochotona princeps TaxID=9978 RepID=UPI0027148D14